MAFLAFSRLTYHDLAANSATLKADGDPLFFRAWTYQERLLSARTLVFSRGGMYWRCQTAYHDSPHTDGFDGSGEQRLPDALFDTRMTLPAEASNTPTAWQVFQSWNRQVQNFGRCELSVDSDKFPAVAGIAESYDKKFGHLLGSYLAGLWGNFMIEGMRWSVQPARKFSRRPKYRAPTWSWAALNGSIVWQSKIGEFKLLAQALEVGLRWTAENFKYGEIQPPGLVVVRGPFVAVKLADERSKTAEAILGYDLSVKRSMLGQKVIGAGVLDPDKWPNGPFFALVLASEKHSNGNRKAFDLDGLLILPIESQKDAFVRCGWFHAWKQLLDFTEEKTVHIY
jgi:hypothetical protein